jgi:hypothetical protein
VTALEEELQVWLESEGSPESARAAFEARFGADAGVRFARAERALAYLRAHHETLRAAGLLALGEKPGDIRLDPRFAAELAALAERANV